MSVTETNTKTMRAASFSLRRYVYSVFVGALGILLGGGIWFGLPQLSAHARIAFITFGLAILGWMLTDINDTYIALIASMVFTVLGIDSPNEFFEALGDSTIWLLLASFVVAAGVVSSGLSHRLTALIAARAGSVGQLFYILTAAIFLSAFIIPATSGRAALMLPFFTALSHGIGNPRVSKALALLFPTVILLSASGSLIGAGAHLVTVDILAHMGNDKISFWQWLVWGLPFALVSCFLSTWIILHVFLTRAERRMTLRLTPDQLADPASGKLIKPGKTVARQQRFVLIVVLALIALWATESIHGMDSAIVALLGALAITMPSVGVISFKDAFKHIDWNIIIFMAATVELGEALVESGGSEWLMQGIFNALPQDSTPARVLVISLIALVSLLSHLLINSRTARSSVLIPLIVILSISLGYNPTTLAFLSTVAAGFCLTLPVSAKPVAMFSQIENKATYQPKDLLRLSGLLLPIHFVLLLVFTFTVWPRLGLSLEYKKLTTAPAPPQWITLNAIEADRKTHSLVSILTGKPTAVQNEKASSQDQITKSNNKSRSSTLYKP